jgi:hypothetical protein
VTHANPSRLARKTSYAGLAKRGPRVTQMKLKQMVRNYLYRVFDKLGVSTRVELVLYCLQDRQRASKLTKGANA